MKKRERYANETAKRDFDGIREAEDADTLTWIVPDERSTSEHNSLQLAMMMDLLYGPSHFELN